MSVGLIFWALVVKICKPSQLSLIIIIYKEESHLKSRSFTLRVCSTRDSQEGANSLAHTQLEREETFLSLLTEAVGEGVSRGNQGLNTDEQSKEFSNKSRKEKEEYAIVLNLSISHVLILPGVKAGR